MKTINIFIFTFLLFLNSFGQISPIDITENTLKIGGLSEEVFYFGFAEGDQIIFNFEEKDNKELKEIEILEYPSSSKFMDYKSKKIENKTINVSKTGIYTFRLMNGAIMGRIYKIKIQRIPKSEETKSFNTSTEIKTFNDTTWVTKSKSVIDKIDTIPELVLDKQGEIVHVALNSRGAYSNVEVILPKNTAYWTYWIGVGADAHKSFSRAEEKIATKSLTYLGIANPLAALAVGVTSHLISETAVDNVSYNLKYYRNINNVNQEFIFHNGGDIVKPDFGVMHPPKAPLEGYVYFNLYNDNKIDPISVYIKVMAIKITKTYKTIQYKEPNVKTYIKPVMIQ